MKNLLCTLGLWCLVYCVPVLAQRYSVDWYKVAGGGGSSTGGAYSVNGTIGQLDATAALTGGNFSLVGGFWAVSVVQAQGAPLLSINLMANQPVVSWPVSASGWILQTNSNLGTAAWGDYLGLVVNNTVTNSSLTGNLFFRLRQP